MTPNPPKTTSEPLPPVPGSAICGHCGQRRDKHFFEVEIYCFENTTGDLWTAEPGWENIGAMIESEYPTLWRKMVAKWKEDNGHSPNGRGERPGPKHA